ncbi:MAG: asparagine synthase (glutamine-hydrolyzing) [Sulfurovum sp.]|nr:asparagine synthase (glutamine-hydrolyzing) [Sulfurovum sp.]
MCGISGIINKNQKQVNEDEIKSINDLITHRGPDDEGFYHERNFAFGHRRLSILDLSSDGHQPMHYLDERYTITYNGEVYNYLEIRDELKKDGYTFHSDTDTEVVLASYDKWGEECVNRFNGMWAFAIYDKEKDTIFCSRDRFGIKPFYYTEIDGRFIFGSEIKQLLEFYSQKFVNKNVLMDYLIIGYEDHTNETFFENIFKLEQSHNLTYCLRSNTFKINKYYSIKKRNLNKNEKDSIDKYRKSLFSAIELRLRSDVKVGTCLSGGLDSSSIASVASKEYQNKSASQFTAIHAKSFQQNNDESKYAQEVSDYCDLDLSIIEPITDEFLENIDEVVYTQEEPFGDSSVFMQYFVMKKAREIGCIVMLDGQGGDETLLGYERYYPAYLKSLSFLERISGIFSSTKNSKLSLVQLLQYYVYFTNAKIRLSRLLKQNSFVKTEYMSMINQKLLDQSARSFMDTFELQKLEIFKTQMPHLLRYEDKNSMRNSVETRLPFIDYNVLETAINTHENLKIKDGWTKYILRKSVDNILPSSIVWRRNKLGFEAPTKSWMYSIEGQIEKMIDNSKIINTVTDNIDFNKLNEIQKWKLFNIAKWEQIYGVEIR